MTDNVIKSLKWLIFNFPEIENPKDDADKISNCIHLYCQNAVDELNRQKAEIERLNRARQKQAQFLVEERGQKYELINKITKAKSEAVREFAEKITEMFVRYAHLHNYAEKSRTETIESAEGEKIEMQSVWDVLSLKKYEMAEYEEMSELQKNIEIIAKERLLTELEKDFRLLVKEMVGDCDA